jgi:hypothetical protein
MSAADRLHGVVRLKVFARQTLWRLPTSGCRVGTRRQTMRVWGVCRANKREVTQTATVQQLPLICLIVAVRSSGGPPANLRSQHGGDVSLNESRPERVCRANSLAVLLKDEPLKMTVRRRVLRA